MRRGALHLLPALAAILVLLRPGTGLALDRQLRLGGYLGFLSTQGRLGGPGATAQAFTSYGLNDTFSFYAVGAYGLGFPATPEAPLHLASLSAGVYYAFDYISIVPWLGLGLRGDLAIPATSMAAVGFSAEVRGGLAYHFNRTLALDLQLAYGLSIYPRSSMPDAFTATVGLVRIWDL